MVQTDDQLSEKLEVSRHTAEDLNFENRPTKFWERAKTHAPDENICTGKDRLVKDGLVRGQCVKRSIPA